VDLLKRDIQGQEHSALSGASNLIADGRIGTIFVELKWAGVGEAVCPATEVVRLREQGECRFSRLGPQLNC
jgi:Methyltransferase FkbM domain